jgi:hypothetical protein
MVGQRWVKIFFWKKKKVWHSMVGTGQWHREWQWQGGSGVIRQRRSRRFEWYRLQFGSGSIGRVGIGQSWGLIILKIFLGELALGCWDRVAVWRVAVAGWQWCHSIDQIKAVRMVVV